ncbi:MAG: Gfo/Idh/MocA family oxidoreductase [Pirellulales bacterium]|nr:Gfo/Idh/MocA family oxidoreductase [Pirellulales bacterium]
MKAKNMTEWAEVQTTISRRLFLQSSTMGAGALAFSMRGLAAEVDERVKAAANPSEKLGVAVIGAGIRGDVHCKEFTKRSDVEILFVCDADRAVGQKRVEGLKAKGHRTQLVQDVRRLLDEKSVDAVSIATPNHWHALAAVWAMQAGKDVYVEKPVSHNVAEGRAIVETARKQSRICQAGMQCRSMQGTIDAIEYVRSGKIGVVKLARGLCYNLRKPIGPKGKYDPPSEVDYNLWSGPAELLPVTRPQFHYDWHWQWPYGNGDLGNQGVHQMDIARWGLGQNGLSKRVFSYGGRLGYNDASETPNTQVVVHEFDDATLVFEVRGLKTSPLRGASVGVIFYGSDGYVVLTSYTDGAAFDGDGKLVKRFSGGGDHFGNFLEAVRSRKQENLTADILEGHLSSALCHTGNISWRLGAELPVTEIKSRLAAESSHKDATETFERFAIHLQENGMDPAAAEITYGAELSMDPQRETFANSVEANAMLTREYRKPFELQL